MTTAWVVSYDGGLFYGSAAQPGMKTVQGVFARELEVRVGHPVKIAQAGRTDAGVHARGQVFTCEDSSVEVDWVDGLNASLVRRGLQVRGASQVADDFSARFDARSRHYIYRIRLGEDVLARGRAWCVRDPLDVSEMVRGAMLLTGVHDFSALCKARASGGYEREVREIVLIESAGFLDISIVGTSFCHEMVRRMVGTLVGVGKHRIDLSQLASRFGARDRAFFSVIAPPGGLYLWRVNYSEEMFSASESYRTKGFSNEWCDVALEEFGFRVD